MKNGWTGGQYSVFRLLLGLCLAAVFVRSGLAVESNAWILFLAGVPAVVLALGVVDRAAAVVCGCVLVFVWTTGPDAFSLFLTIPLLAHCFAPPAPYGSWRARGRPDPGGGWRLPPLVFLVERALILALFLWAGIWATATSDGPILLCAVSYLLMLALFVLTPYRLAVWFLLVVSVGLMSWLIEQFSGAWFLLTFTLFNPGWVRPRIGSGKATMFYDGECALCHGGVRFILAEDRFDSIRFVPLQSEIFKERVTASERERMGDTVVFETETGELLSRSTAITYMLQRLGGLWRIAGALLHLIPPLLRNFAYDLVAATRYQVFGKKKEHCPIVPPEFRGRFDL